MLATANETLIICLWPIRNGFSPGPALAVALIASKDKLRRNVTLLSPEAGSAIHLAFGQGARRDDEQGTKRGRYA